MEDAFKLYEKNLNNKLKEIVYTAFISGRKHSWYSVYYEEIDRKVSVEQQEAVLCSYFVDLEKVLIEQHRKCSGMLSRKEKYLVQSILYSGFKTAVFADDELSDFFVARFGVH